MTDKKLISVIVPCYNEQEVIRLTHDRLTKLALSGYRREIVYIDAAGHGIYAGDGINPQGTIGTIKAGKDGIRSEGNNLLISGPVGDITAGGYGIYAGGTSDIIITGYKNGEATPIFKNGTWAF